MYETLSSDNLPLTSTIKKSNNFKSNNTTISTTDHHHHVHHDNQQNDSQSSQTSQPQISNSTNNQTLVHENSSNLSQCLSGGDMLLQWGLRKRSRCSRMEGRSLTNHITPSVSLPCKNNVCENGGASTSRVRPKDGVLYAKEPPPILPARNRNLSDQMGCSSTSSPSRNGATMARSGGPGKRSPPKGSGGSIKRVKSDDSLPQNHRAELARGGSGGGGCGGGVSNGNNNLANTSPMIVVDGEKSNGEVVKCPRIYLTLSRKEKEDDFYAMKGTKLPHRPKKRAKAVDRALQYIYPGLWLSDLTKARYEVRERKSTKKVKRKGGLKGLENMDSESE